MSEHNVVLSVDHSIDADLFTEEHLSPGPLSPIHTPVAEQRDHTSPQLDASLSPIPPLYVALNIGAWLRQAEQHSAISPFQNWANLDSLPFTELPLSQEQLACDDRCDDLSETADEKSIYVSDSALVALGCQRNRMRYI